MANPNKRAKAQADAEREKVQQQIQDTIGYYKHIDESLQSQINWYRDINDKETMRGKISDQNAQRQQMINELLKNQSKLTKDQVDLLEKLKGEQKEALEIERQTNAELKKQKANREVINGVLRENVRLLREGWKYLMESDKAIKNTILNLGLSGAKADLMRGAFEQSAGFVARMGGSLEDIQNIMEGYADETGRARALSAEMVEDITMIGKGTGLGIEQAAKLGAQFEYLGLSAKGTMDYVQGIVDTSERMGVNTTKVLKNLNDNFKKLNTFTFIKGSKAMAEMAMNAEKMRVDMADALNVAEATRGLEKVIELTANLQVMGGEFAKLDPFQALFMSRNEPEKWNEEISKMTRGLFTFKKNSEGVFEKFISPVDADRLRNVAKSLGISEEKLFQIGQRRLDLDKMNQDMASMGLTDKEKELVQGAAIFNEKSAKFQVMLAGSMRDISTLTADQARSFAKEQVSLQERAKQAQTFDEVFKVTINELKATLLPLLRTVNDMLVKIRPLVIQFTEWISKGPSAWIKVALLFMGVTTAIKLAGGYLSRIGEGLLTKLSGFNAIGEKMGGATGGGGGGGRVIGGRASAGKGLMRGGIGVGAAGAGVGGGIGLAAMGIADLAKAIKDVDVAKLKAMNGTIIILGATMAAILIPAMFALAAAGPFAALGLAALGAAAVGVGFGISLAAKGIGVMATGLGTMFEKSKGAGNDMLKIAGGIAGIAAALALFNFSGIGLGVFAGVMGTITVAALASAAVANSFAKMGTAMRGTKDDWIAVEQAITSIGKANFKGGGALTELANMLKKPLRVEFADKEVALNTYVTLDVNGEQFLQAVGATAHVQNNQERAKKGVETVKHR